MSSSGMDSILINTSSGSGEGSGSSGWSTTTIVAVAFSCGVLLIVIAVFVIFMRRRKPFLILPGPLLPTFTTATTVSPSDPRGGSRRPSQDNLSWSPVTTLNATPFASHPNTPFSTGSMKRASFMTAMTSPFGSRTSSPYGSRNASPMRPAGPTPSRSLRASWSLSILSEKPSAQQQLTPGGHQYHYRLASAGAREGRPGAANSGFWSSYTTRSGRTVVGGGGVGGEDGRGSPTTVRGRARRSGLDLVFGAKDGEQAEEDDDDAYDGDVSFRTLDLSKYLGKAHGTEQDEEAGGDNDKENRREAFVVSGREKGLLTKVFKTKSEEGAEEDKEGDEAEKRSISPLFMTPVLSRLPSVKSGSTSRVSELVRARADASVPWEKEGGLSPGISILNSVTPTSAGDHPPRVNSRMSVVERRSALFVEGEVEKIFI